MAHPYGPWGIQLPEELFPGGFRDSRTIMLFPGLPPAPGPGTVRPKRPRVEVRAREVPKPGVPPNRVHPHM